MNGFGLDHLPYGVFSVAGGPRRVGVRYDDDEGAWVVDLHGETGRPEFAEPSLNAFMAPRARRSGGRPARRCARSSRAAASRCRSRR